MPITLSPIASGYNLSAINDNFETIASTWDEKVDRMVSDQGNQMEQALDMNGNYILNVADAVDDTHVVTLGRLRDYIIEQGGDTSEERLYVYKESISTTPVENMIAGYPYTATNGYMVATTGYESNGDGKGAIYVISDDGSNLTDNDESLDSGLYAIYQGLAFFPLEKTIDYGSIS